MDLDVSSNTVEKISSEYITTLVLSNGAQFQIESECKYSRAGEAPVLVPPPDPGGSIEPISALLGARIEFAVVEDLTGNLILTFEGGIQVEVDSDPVFEAWSYTDADGSRLVALAGGGVSRWSTN